jgi:ankyrin repeat protein
MQAASSDRLDCVQLLILKGADLKAKSKDGNTALTSASAYPDVVKVLNAAGAL